MSKIIWMICFLSLGISGLYATSISNNFGLTSPTKTITFDEIVFTQGTQISTQYASYGVTFTSGMIYDSQSTASFPGITGHYLGNGSNPTFSIYFSANQTAAAVGLATNPATTTFTALLNGAVVETFSIATTFDNASLGFYGFTGITFNELKVSVSSGAALFDNIEMGVAAPVPEPCTLLLLVFGGLCMLYTKKSSTPFR